MKGTITQGKKTLFLLTTYYQNGSELDDVIDAVFDMKEGKNIAIVMYGYEGFPLVHIKVCDGCEDYDEVMRLLKEDIQSDKFRAPEEEFQDAIGRHDITMREILLDYMTREGY